MFLYIRSSFKGDGGGGGGEEKKGRKEKVQDSALSISEITVVDNNWEEASVDDSTSCKLLQNLGPLTNLQKYVWVGTYSK